jgi:hypothetical protein
VAGIVAISETLVGPRGPVGPSIELRKTDTHIQWRPMGGTTWIDLVTIEEITGPEGTNDSAIQGVGITKMEKCSAEQYAAYLADPPEDFETTYYITPKV